MTEFACPEVELHWKMIEQPVERILATLEGRSIEERNWRPPAPDTNSLHVLAVHVLGNVRENILEFICGQDVGRERDAEFRAVADASNDPLQDWPAHKAELEAAMRGITREQLGKIVDTFQRGPRSGRELLMQSATHANEHTGHAELTRDLLLASK